MTEDELQQQARQMLEDLLAAGIRADEARTKVHQWVDDHKKEATNG